MSNAKEIEYRVVDRDGVIHAVCQTESEANEMVVMISSHTETPMYVEKAESI